MKKVKETLDKWEKKRPRETRWDKVFTVINRLGFEIAKTEGSILWIRHDKLPTLDPTTYGDFGGVKIHKKHRKGGARNIVTWFDLKKIMRAARTILEAGDIEEEANEANN